MAVTLRNTDILFNDGSAQPKAVIGPGAAPFLPARAWCNFNGATTTPSQVNTSNVSSVTRVGTGTYFVTYAFFMTDAAGTVAVTCNSGVGDGSVFARIRDQSVPEVGGCAVETMRPGVGPMDSSSVHFVVFR